MNFFLSFVNRYNCPLRSTAEGKRERHRAERVWAKDKSTVNIHNLNDKQREVRRLCNKAKVDFYQEKITAAGKDAEILFKFTNQLLCKTKQSILPTYVYEKILADTFAEYFSNKIFNIMATT